MDLCGKSLGIKHFIVCEFIIRSCAQINVCIFIFSSELRHTGHVHIVSACRKIDEQGTSAAAAVLAQKRDSQFFCPNRHQVTAGECTSGLKDRKVQVVHNVLICIIKFSVQIQID